MGLKIGETTSSIPTIEKGMYPARLVQVIDFGTQPVEDMKTKKVTPKHRVWLTFELPDELITVGDEEKPRWVSKEYNVSYNEKATLKKVVDVLVQSNPDAETLGDLVGAPCMVEVGHTSGGNAKVVNVTPVPKRMTVGELVNDPFVFDLGEYTAEEFLSLPQFMQDKINNPLNSEYNFPEAGSDEPF